MAGVVVVTDSSADIPAQLAEALGILVAPVGIDFHDGHFLDGQLRRSDFYRRLKEAGELPTTSGVAAEVFQQAFRKAAGRAEMVLCLIMSFETSFTSVAAEVAVRRTPDVPVRIMATGRGLAGHGALCIAVATAAKQGKTAEEVWRLAEDLSLRAEAYVVPATLEYLHKAQKVTELQQAGMGPLEGMLPVIRVRGRMTPTAKERTFDAALRTLLTTVAQSVGQEVVEVIVEHADASDAGARLAEMAQSRLRCHRVHLAELTPMVGRYLGPGAVGLGYCPWPQGLG
jgi:DegV family protein with EDD domain